MQYAEGQAGMNEMKIYEVQVFTTVSIYINRLECFEVLQIYLILPYEIFRFHTSLFVC